MLNGRLLVLARSAAIASSSADGRRCQAGHQAQRRRAAPHHGATFDGRWQSNSNSQLNTTADNVCDAQPSSTF